MIAVIVIVAIVLLLLLILVLSYNGLIKTRNRVDNAWSQIDVQLKRRHDLIPNLVETVKGYAAHERQTLEAVTNARANAINAGNQGTVADQAQAENVLSGALKSLFAVAEAYPDLKANQNFLELQGQLSDTENKIAVSRQVYNDTVLTYNNSIQTFPAVMLANSFGFQKREFFEVENAADRDAPQVSFTTGGAPAAPAADTTAAPPAPAPPSDAPGT